MTATSALTADLQRQVLLLEDDLRARVAADTDLEGRWKQEHHRAVEKERTAASWVTWRDDRVTQAAVAWVLTTVFTRFCEDNALVKPVWIAGPKTRRQEALDQAQARQPTHVRSWLIFPPHSLSPKPAPNPWGHDSGQAARQRGRLESWAGRPPACPGVRPTSSA